MWGIILIYDAKVVQEGWKPGSSLISPLLRTTSTETQKTMSWSKFLVTFKTSCITAKHCKAIQERSRASVSESTLFIWNVHLFRLLVKHAQRISCTRILQLSKPKRFQNRASHVQKPFPVDLMAGHFIWRTWEFAASFNPIHAWPHFETFLRTKHLVTAGGSTKIAFRSKLEKLLCFDARSASKWYATCRCWRVIHGHVHLSPVLQKYVFLQALGKPECFGP